MSEKYVMSRIKDLDRQITPLIATLQHHAKRLAFRRVCRLDDEEMIARQLYAGVYLIEIHVEVRRFKTVEKWLEKFKAEWDGDRPKKHFTPGTKAKRVKEHPRLKAWMPLYLGIRMTTVAERIQQHMSLKAAANTGGLKLKSRRKIRLHDLRLSTIELELNSYASMMPAIESTLRNELHPILGR